MNTVPIVFAFDNNLAMPAAVCIFSLLKNAKDTTTYDIFILKREGEKLDLSLTERILSEFSRHRLTVRTVGDTFDNSFEIRGITTPAYYRLLIPGLIPEYDTVLYSDVDVIFRQDLADVYNENLGDDILAGVNNLAHIDKDLRDHYEGTLHLDPDNVICSGFLVMDTKTMREEHLENKFVAEAKNNYKFQDQDVLNIVCRDRIKMLPPKYSLLTYISFMTFNRPDELSKVWTKEDIADAMTAGNIHYNGQKPWRGYCLNFDVWWEYYRKSPIFDERFYFDFFYGKLNELDHLPLVKRLKILARYFVYGKAKT